MWISLTKHGNSNFSIDKLHVVEMDKWSFRCDLSTVELNIWDIHKITKELVKIWVKNSCWNILHFLSYFEPETLNQTNNEIISACI